MERSNNGIKDPLRKDAPLFSLADQKPELLSDAGYKQLTTEEKARICNGAGAAGRWISSFIPNTMYGLDCIEAFDIHDYDYHVGITRADKDRADRRMLDNLLILINHAGGLLAWLRRRRAMKYYEAVHQFGDSAFFHKGNDDYGRGMQSQTAKIGNRAAAAQGRNRNA
ncbi:hypothetical protein [Methylobacter sp.]|uniref:hypothetical protein n=1 Tax=Methylobacter sp. TaxID=2051955 RepID=UPI003DA267D3